MGHGWKLVKNWLQKGVQSDVIPNMIIIMIILTILPSNLKSIILIL